MFFCCFRYRGDKTAPNTAEVADEEAGPGHPENRDAVVASSKTGSGSSLAAGEEGSESKNKEKSWESEGSRF